MAEIKGTNVASKIVPYTDSDEYATHDEKYGVGGYRTVDSVSEMNAIPAARRKEGMLVYVKGDKIYKLNSSNTFVNAGLGVGEVIDWNSGSNLSQNGYQKFSNGLMLQWGYNSGSNVNPLTIYMPNSFYDTSYLVFGSIIKNATDAIVYTACPLVNSYVGSFKIDRNFNSGSIGTSSAKFCWFAIGRWK